jgi:hypothetical protein
VAVGAGGGGDATASGPDVDVVVARVVAGPGRGLDRLDPPVETAGGRVDGAKVVEGIAGASATLGAAVVTEGSEVGGACGPGPAGGGADFEVGAPALTVVETWRLRS